MSESEIDQRLVVGAAALDLELLVLEIGDIDPQSHRAAAARALLQPFDPAAVRRRPQVPHALGAEARDPLLGAFDPRRSLGVGLALGFVRKLAIGLADGIGLARYEARRRPPPC